MLQADYEDALARGYDPCEDYSPLPADTERAWADYRRGRNIAKAVLNPAHEHHRAAVEEARAIHAAGFGRAGEAGGLLSAGCGRVAVAEALARLETSAA